MFAIHRKSTGPSATELLEASRKEYVKTEALKNAKIDPGRPRIFSHDDEDEKQKIASTLVRFRHRIPVQPSNSPDLICFCVTSTPMIRPSSYKPLETPHGAFRRVEKQQMAIRAKSTPPRAPPRPPPPRPPKPLWLKDCSQIRTADKSQEGIVTTTHIKPIPAPRLSKQTCMRRQTAPLSCAQSLPKKEESSLEFYPELEKLRVSSCSADADAKSSANKVNEYKAIGSLTTTPSTSRGTMSPYGGRCTRNSIRDATQNSAHLCGNFTSPDSDSGLHHSSIESLDNPFYNMADSNRDKATNAQLATSRSEPEVKCGSFEAEDRRNRTYAPVACVDEGSVSMEMSQVGSMASLFTSVTGVYRTNSSISVSDRSSTNAQQMVDSCKRLDTEPSLIEKNARVIKWIYSCRTAVA
uniref:Centrosome-associated FAM110 C-terminal domain-containing protein n=1 Tax=Parascaris univalens TaxID=6257 RepID=A0A915ATN3_PARUN